MPRGKIPGRSSAAKKRRPPNSLYCRHITSAEFGDLAWFLPPRAWGMRAAGGFSRALVHQVTVPPRKDPVTAYLRELRDEVMPVDAGEVARYIPELANADPRHLGIAIATCETRCRASRDAN